ncbi:hypothetical protein TNCV_93441 [Trichonephila clavipes]|nr:hypothetical protein TNCV_93441 [Trichonephila clavipes]
MGKPGKSETLLLHPHTCSSVRLSVQNTPGIHFLRGPSVVSPHFRSSHLNPQTLSLQSWKQVNRHCHQGERWCYMILRDVLRVLEAQGFNTEVGPGPLHKCRSHL